MLSTIVLAIVPSLVGMVARSVPAAGARSLIDTAIDAQEWDSAGVRDRLDAYTIDELEDVIGPGERLTAYAVAAGEPWSMGDGRPDLADDDPAVQQVIAYCAANRARAKLKPAPTFISGDIHPSTCGYCSYDDDEIFKAVGWSVMTSRYILDEVVVWRGAKGHSDYYRRTDRLGQYDSPKHKLFWGMPLKDRQYLVAQAAKSIRPAVAA